MSTAVTSAQDEQVLFEGHPATLPSLGAWLVAIVTLGIGALVYWLRARGVRYRITTQRVIVERGILSKRMDQIDLYRINDYVVDRPLMQRIVGTGNLTLEAMDKTSRELTLRGLPTDVVALYEALRKATEDEKRRRGVRVVDYEQ
ncbi:MAG: PH domain-containing protein [Myxococcales bacterium]|nr:PH domain-containing protein [Myxococcales bacterium]